MGNNDKKRQLLAEHAFLNSEVSKKFTEELLVEFGKEVEQMFPKVSFVLSARYKSDISFEGKLERILARTDKTKKQIYDNIGFKLVITSLPDIIEHAACQEIINKKNERRNTKQAKIADRDAIIAKLGTPLQEEAADLLESIDECGESLKKYYQLYKLRLELLGIDKEKNLEESAINEYVRLIQEMEELLKQHKPKYKSEQSETAELRKELITTRLALLSVTNQNISYITELINEEDKRANDLYATYVFEELRKKSKVLKKYGISSVPGRSKRHTGSKHYYVASHDSLASTKGTAKHGIPEEETWMVELQVTSDYYNQDATSGKAKHSEKEGKARILPKIPSSKEEYNKTIKPIVPENIIYVSGSDEVYRCTSLEDFHLYYAELIQPNYLNRMAEVLEEDEHSL